MITIKSKGDNGLICKLKGNQFVVMNDVSNAIRAIVGQDEKLAFAVMVGLAVCVPQTKVLELVHDAYAHLKELKGEQK